MAGVGVGIPAEAWEFQSHVKLMHGVWVGDVRTVKALRELHEDVHADPIGRGIPHEHRDLSDPLQDWSW